MNALATVWKGRSNTKGRIIYMYFMYGFPKGKPKKILLQMELSFSKQLKNQTRIWK